MMGGATEDFKPGLQPKPTEKNINTAAVEKMMAGATKDFKPGLQPKPTEKNINTAAVEKRMGGATEDFKPGLQFKPPEKNTCIGEAAAVEKMMAGATEDSKPGLKTKPNGKNLKTTVAEKATGVTENDFRQGRRFNLEQAYNNNGRTSIQQQRESRRRRFVGRVQFRDSLDSIVRMGQLEHPQILVE